MVEEIATDRIAVKVNQDQEVELLVHVAAGTDPLTALAALPREDESPQQSASRSDQWFSAIAWIIVAGIGFGAWLLLL
jgi:hypothetical protein